MEIKISKHIIDPNQKVIEILENNKLIATIIPRNETIKIISKYIKNVESDMEEYPPTIIINLKESDIMGKTDFIWCKKFDIELIPNKTCCWDCIFECEYNKKL